MKNYFPKIKQKYPSPSIVYVKSEKSNGLIRHCHIRHTHDEKATPYHIYDVYVFSRNKRMDIREEDLKEAKTTNKKEDKEVSNFKERI